MVSRLNDSLTPIVEAVNAKTVPEEPVTATVESLSDVVHMRVRDYIQHHAQPSPQELTHVTTRVAAHFPMPPPPPSVSWWHGRHRRHR